jgi:acyl carrier protein
MTSSLRCEDCEPRIKDIVVKTLGLTKPSCDIRSDEDLIQTYGINSIDALELLMLVEHEFNLEIPDEELKVENLRTVRSLALFVVKLKETNVERGD